MVFQEYLDEEDVTYFWWWTPILPLLSSPIMLQISFYS